MNKKASSKYFTFNYYIFLVINILKFTKIIIKVATSSKAPIIDSHHDDDYDDVHSQRSKTPVNNDDDYDHVRLLRGSRTPVINDHSPRGSKTPVINDHSPRGSRT